MDTINNIVRKLRENRIINEREDYTQKSRDELILLAKEGDQLAIETLVSTHKDFLGRMTAKYILSSGDKEDIDQMALIAFWDAIQSYNPDKNGDFEAFAGMVIKRKLTDEIRKDSAGKRQIHNTAQSIDATTNSTSDDGSEATLGDTVVDPNSDPSEIYSAKEAAEAIRRFMEEKLSDVELEVVKRKIAGDKVSKIAEETGMKYKSVENALMRVKNKLAEYMRNRESKKIDESENSVEFSDEEKSILKSALSQIDRGSITESAQLKEAYENYTETQLDTEIEGIELEIEKISDEMRNTPYDDRDELYDMLKNLKTRLYAMEEYLTDEQYKKTEDLRNEIGRAEDQEYEGESRYTDPYMSRGLSRADFR